MLLFLPRADVLKTANFLNTHVTTGYSVEYSVALYVCIQLFDRYWYNTVKCWNTLKHHITSQNVLTAFHVINTGTNPEYSNHSNVSHFSSRQQHTRKHTLGQVERIWRNHYGSCALCMQQLIEIVSSLRLCYVAARNKWHSEQNSRLMRKDS